MLSYQTVEPHTLELIKKIMGTEASDGLRLVGGTALALQYGHRSSVDIDLFGQTDTDNESLHDALAESGELKIIKESKNISIYSIGGIKVDIVNYKYQWLRPAVMEDGIRLASPEDIAAMKINAAEGRGTKKDFIDIYFLLEHYPLERILEFYSSKYPEHSIFRALMSLTYFDDADCQPMPKMFSDVPWEEMKRVISNAVTGYSKNT